MDAKKLRKMGRAELLEMLISQSRELQECQERLKEAEEQLKKAQQAQKSHEIALNNAGSIAEASLMLSGVFEAAQAACQQYTDNIRLLSERQDKICADREAESRARADSLIAEAERRSAEMERDARQRSEEMLNKAREESQRCWDDVSARLEAFCDAHSGLREMLSVLERPREQK